MAGKKVTVVKTDNHGDRKTDTYEDVRLMMVDEKGFLVIKFMNDSSQWIRLSTIDEYAVE